MQVFLGGVHLPIGFSPLHSLGTRKPGALNSSGALVLIRAFFRYSKLEVAETPQPSHPLVTVAFCIWPVRMIKKVRMAFLTDPSFNSPGKVFF